MKIRTICAIAVASLASSLHAAAADKAQCAAAAESAQELRKAHDLAGARDKLLVCAVPACPKVIADDCRRWLGEIDQSVADDKAATAPPTPPPASEKAAPEPANIEPAPPPPAPQSDEPPRPETRAGMPAAFWALGGVGAVALGSFAYFGLTGRAREDELVSQCAPHCSSSDANTVRTKFAIADVSVAIGVVAIAAAAWVLVTREPAKSSVALDLRGLHF